MWYEHIIGNVLFPIVSAIYMNHVKRIINVDVCACMMNEIY